MSSTGLADWIRRPVPGAALIAGLGWLCAALAAVKLAPYVLTDHPRDFPADFNCFWAAGKSWLSLNSPYSPFYEAILMNGEGLHLHERPPPFFYPPNTIVLFAPLGLLSLTDASFVWALINAAALISASILFASFAAELFGVRRSAVAALHFGIVGGLFAMTEVIFAHNIVSMLLYNGLLMTLIGIRSRHELLIVIGLIISLMKPQLGLPLAVALLFHAETRLAVVAASAITAALCVAGLLTGGFFDSASDFLGNLNRYSLYPENAPGHVGGLGFLLYKSFAIELSVSAGLAASLAAIVIRRFHKRDASALTGAAFAIAAGLFFLPAHNHDYLMIFPVAALLAARDPRAAPLLVAAALLHGAAWTISGAFAERGIGYLVANTSLIDTIAASTIFIIASIQGRMPEARICGSARANLCS